MLNRNTLVAGIILGIALPTLGFILLYNLFGLLEIKGMASSKGFSTDFRERTLGILSIAINLVLLNTYRKRRWEDAMRGVVIATTILAVIWVFMYGIKLLS
jgi:hypothetical protein